MSEEWRLLPNGYYAVSSHGRVRRELPGRGRARAGNILKPAKGGPGYLMVSTVPDGEKRQPGYLHHLIAEVFLGPRPHGMQVNHKDGDKTNNHVLNLEYVTPGQNMAHAYRIGLRKPPSVGANRNVGASNGMAKLTEEDVRTIRADLVSGKRRAEIAQDFRVCLTVVDYIAQGKRWRHVR